MQYEDGTGQGLAQEILNEALRRKKTPSSIIGFGSHGARVMTGQKKGVKLQRKVEEAKSTHGTYSLHGTEVGSLNKPSSN